MSSVCVLYIIYTPNVMKAKKLGQNCIKTNMNHQSKPILVSCFLILFLVSHLRSPVTAQELDDEGDFDYSNHSKKGPRRWGEIKKEWKACKNGNLQSPIDLTDQRLKLIPKLVQMNKSYKPCNATLKNRGHDISYASENERSVQPLNNRDVHLYGYGPTQ